MKCSVNWRSLVRHWDSRAAGLPSLCLSEVYLTHQHYANIVRVTQPILRILSTISKIYSAKICRTRYWRYELWLVTPVYYLHKKTIISNDHCSCMDGTKMVKKCAIPNRLPRSNGVTYSPWRQKQRLKKNFNILDWNIIWKRKKRWEQQSLQWMVHVHNKICTNVFISISTTEPLEKWCRANIVKRFGKCGWGKSMLSMGYVIRRCTCILVAVQCHENVMQSKFQV